MKGIVFSFKKPHPSANRPRFRLPEITRTVRKNGVTLLFVTVLLTGLALGAAYAQGADDGMLQSLDFLFTTNLDARLEKGAFGIFSACFAVFKGFGTGLTAAYLILKNGMNGLGFYLLVLLPGTFLFCVALATYSAVALDFSVRQFKLLLSKEAAEAAMRESFLRYSSRFVSALIMTFCAALLDTVLWTLFAKAFW